MRFGMNQRKVVLVNIEFSDQSRIKKRPALIVSNNSYNQSEDRIIVPITSVLKNREHEILITDNDLTEGMLKHTSYVRCGHPRVMSQHKILKTIGTVKEKFFLEIKKEIMKVF